MANPLSEEEQKLLEIYPIIMVQDGEIGDDFLEKLEQILALSTEKPEFAAEIAKIDEQLFC